MRRPLISAIVLSFLILVSGMILSQNAFAGEITKSVSNGQTISFRDINNLNETQDPTISLDKENYQLGETATVTVNDTNADLDITAPDFETATVSGSSLTLTETDDSTGVFTGTFTVDGDDIEVEYTPDSKQAARAEVTFPLDSSGSVILSDADFVLGSTDFINATTGPLNVTLTDGAAFTGGTPPTVVLSFANIDIPSGVEVLDLAMYHKAPGQEWELITTSCQTELNKIPPQPCDFFDNTAKTITSDPDGAGFVGTDGQGLYVLAYDTGTPGGGGGGLVRPGLVINALAGIGGFAGGGGADYSPPILQLDTLVTFKVIDVPDDIKSIVEDHDPSTPLEPIPLESVLGAEEYEGFDFPLTINDQGYVISGYSNTIQTHTVQPGQENTIRFVFFEPNEVAHVSLYMNLRDAITEIHQSDTQILLDAGEPIKLKDPNGYFESVSGMINELEGNKKEAVFDVTFAKEMDTTNIIVRTWDDKRQSFDTHINEALQVKEPATEEEPVQTFEEPQIEQLTSQRIPIWVKNNAGWWSDGMIGDSDFVAGIEHLVQNEIILVDSVSPDGSSQTDVPAWVKNNAGWWSERIISDEEFIDAIEWLIKKGVIEVNAE